MKKDTGQRIKNLREQHTKLTQPQAADEFAVSKDTYMAWERGKTFPPPPKMVEIADRFGTTLDYLYRGKELVANDLTQKEKRLLMFFRRIPDDKKEGVIIDVAVKAAEEEETH